MTERTIEEVAEALGGKVANREFPAGDRRAAVEVVELEDAETWVFPHQARAILAYIEEREAKVRDDALEEAAKACEPVPRSDCDCNVCNTGRWFAKYIRALKEKPHENG